MAALAILAVLALIISSTPPNQKDSRTTPQRVFSQTKHFAKVHLHLQGCKVLQTASNRQVTVHMVRCKATRLGIFK
jgi:hypothetical protein